MTKRKREINIFATWAPRYFEMGINVMPMAGKAGREPGFQVWGTRAQTEDELEYLVDKYPTLNIGACPGYNFTAVDVDSDNEGLLELLPQSPLSRRGKTGLIRLYKKNNMQNTNCPDAPIEILNGGRGLVLPPSIHPVTKEPYFWLGDNNPLFESLDELPEFTLENLEAMTSYCRKMKIERPKHERREMIDGKMTLKFTDTGRNTKLSNMAYAMACDNVAIEEAVERLIDFDKSEHPIPWFSDQSEFPHYGKNPQATAEKMFKRKIKAASKRGDVKEPIDIDSIKIVFEEPKPLAVKYPKPRGFMRDFADYCNLISRGDQDALGLGGALALMSVLVSNKFYTKSGGFDVWPNLFVINLASSGAGKETAQSVIDELLVDTKLLGSATYKSGTSIIMTLPDQPERLDVVDECSALLKAMGSKEDFKSEIVEVLSLLYSKSSSRYQGIATRADGSRFGACFNPCVNILGSTTPAGFKASVNREMAAKGLLPRFLLFWQEEIGEFKEVMDSHTAEIIKARMKRHIKPLIKLEKIPYIDPDMLDFSGDDAIDLTRPGDVRVQPRLVPMTPDAQKFMTDISRRYFYQGKENPDGFESAFKNRFAQHVAKLALLDAVSLSLELLDVSEIEIGLDSVEWAYSVVKMQWEAAKPLYELASAESPHEQLLMRVKLVVEKYSPLSKRDFSRRTQFVGQARLRTDILKQLEDMGYLTVTPCKTTKGSFWVIKA